MGYWSYIENSQKSYVLMATIYEQTLNHKTEILKPSASLKTIFTLYPDTMDEGQFLDEDMRVYDFSRKGTR